MDFMKQRERFQKAAPGAEIVSPGINTSRDVMTPESGGFSERGLLNSKIKCQCFIVEVRGSLKENYQLTHINLR